MSKRKEYVVTISQGRSLAEVAKELSREGFSIDQKLEQIGVITGTGPTESVKKLRAIPGVVDVSPSSAVDVGPPDSPVS